MRLLFVVGAAAVLLAACDPTGNRASLNDIGSLPAPANAITISRVQGLAVSTANGDPRAYHARLDYCERRNARSDAALQARMEREAASQASSGSGTIRVELRGADVDANAAAFRDCLAAAGYRLQ